jgi:hypothetical protein
MPEEWQTAMCLCFALFANTDLEGFRHVKSDPQ